MVVSNDPAERRVCAPAGLQEAIDSLVAAAGEQVCVCVCVCMCVCVWRNAYCC